MKGERIKPSDQNYLKGFFVRHFAKKANELQSPPFEVNEKNFEKSSLYVYVKLKWYLAGLEEKVYVKNSNEIIKASKTISNIGKILPKMQYYRYDRSLDPKESIKERLGIRGTTTTETDKESNGESKTFEETHGESNGGAY